MGVQRQSESARQQRRQVLVVGGGIGGLAAAMVLAHDGHEVTLLERDRWLGGKLRRQAAGASWVDAGPTVFTLKPFFEALWQRVGQRLHEHVQLQPLDILARHAWTDGERLDLHAGVEDSVRAIAAFAGAAEAQRYRRFAQRSAQIFQSLEHSFMRASRPDLATLVWRAGMSGLARMAPFARLAGALAQEFQNPRLRQLFGRYATYCGASPYLAPATLMLIAHAEQRGVWTVAGGMHRLAEALVGLARHFGARLHTEATVAQLRCEAGRANGVVLADGTRIDADAVIFNGDAAALAQALLGTAARHAVPARTTASEASRRSLSAITWTGQARVQGWAPAHHTVLFSDDAATEFDDLFRRRQLPRQATVYLCAQDRLGSATDEAALSPSGTERLLCLVNAPANGDTAPLDEREMQQCQAQTMSHLARCGLNLDWQADTVIRTDPTQFHQRFPGTGGALYGAATHGWRAAFQRPGSQTRIPGLYLAGGSVHPGPGLPMALTSGWLAAEAVLRSPAFRASSRR